MSGINPGFIVSGVPRLQVTFRDDAGYEIVINASGFWLEKANTKCFVTNKHNIDPCLKMGQFTPYKLAKVEIQLRARAGDQYFSLSKFVEVVNPDVRHHSTADVSLILSPQFEGNLGALGFSSVGVDEIADAQFLSTQLATMDTASFFGFPGRKGEPWWDTAWDTAIARTVNLASHPALPFSNPTITTTDVQLVSGLSFSGSSGSPVFSHEKGINVGGGLQGGNYIAPKLIGIMSGHWWNEEPTAGMFFHSGLSYLTRSTAILDLVKTCIP